MEETLQQKISSLTLLHNGRNLGYDISDHSIGNILKRWGLPTAPNRKKTATWKDFVRSYKDLLGATDFFSTEVELRAKC
jgi:hypothetical protein